jgi:hypothetical protein
MHKNLVKNPEQKKSLGDLNVGAKIILKFLLFKLILCADGI